MTKGSQLLLFREDLVLQEVELDRFEASAPSLAPEMSEKNITGPTYQEQEQQAARHLSEHPNNHLATLASTTNGN